MGTLLSQEKRRISFDNNLAYPPGIPLEHFYNNDNNLELLNPSMDVCDDAMYQEDSHYWAERTAALERQYQQINKIMQTEYENTLNDTKKLFESQEPSNQINKIEACKQWQLKMLKCYDENPRQPLNCSIFVKAFSDCVTACQTEV